MFKIIGLCAAVLMVGLGFLVWKTRQPDHFGEPFTGLPPVGLSELREKPTEFVQKDVAIEGKLMRQCPATGCWFYLSDGKGSDVRVEMGAVLPELPSRTGFNARVEGRLVQKGKEYEFTGTSVEFKK